MNESLLFAVENSIRSVPYEELTSQQRVFRLIWELEAEVNNGGFSQYFFNSSGKYAAYSPDALREIGANQCADIVSQALSLVAITSELWSNEIQRQEIMADLPEETEDLLSALDQKFFKYPDDLSTLLSEFVTSNSDKFAL